MAPRLLLAALLCACGPVVDGSDETSTSGGADSGDVDPPTGTTSTVTTVGEATSVDPDPSTTMMPGTTTTSTDESSSTADTWDDGCAFLCKPDGGTIEIECDIWAQDCPRGEKCMPWANDGGKTWNATRCSPVDDTPAGVGEPCTAEGSGVSGTDNCELGAMCFGVDDETLEGTCVAMCGGSEANPMCADGSACALGGDSVLALCLPICNPLGQDCVEGDACYPVGDAFMCVPIFQPGGFGAACDSVASCDPGFFCANPEAVPGCEDDVGCCSSFCDLAVMNASETCPGVADGQQCVPWWEDGRAPPGLESVGACVIPQ
jgi:hypothetical protein